MKTFAQAAVELGLNPSRLRQLHLEGRLKATKYGNTYVITEREFQRLQSEDRRPGRPAKDR